MREKILFVSSRALYPPYLKVISILKQNYNYDCCALAPVEIEDSILWQTSRPFIQDDALNTQYDFPIYYCKSSRNNVLKYGFDKYQLKAILVFCNPDILFIFDEFWEGLSYQLLAFYRFDMKVKIISFAATNHINKNYLIKWKFPFIKRTRLKQLLVWNRLNGLTTCSTKSAECARRIGLPESIPIIINYLPVFGPEDLEIEKYSLPWNEENNFIIGYAGLLSEQKGWRYLVEAVLSLPDNYKLIIAGEGPQKNELLEYVKTNKSKIHYAGLLSKERLFGLYMQLDLLVLPSVTTSYLVEQMGAVLAEAMSCKVPVVGSSSGAIPEIIGNAGLIFEEKNVDDLVDKIKLICKDEKLREKVIAEGLKKYEKDYSCKSYAASLYNLFENNKM